MSNAYGYLGQYVNRNGTAVVSGGVRLDEFSRFLPLGTQAADYCISWMAERSPPQGRPSVVNRCWKSMQEQEVGLLSAMRAEESPTPARYEFLPGATPAANTTYAPIFATTWRGGGVYQALGGTWDSASHVFTTPPSR